MRLRFTYCLFILSLVAVFASSVGRSQEGSNDECFYENSLHYTANGMAYWYGKENGGLEKLTGIPYTDLGCINCHAAGCDRCHKAEQGNENCKSSYYSTSMASNQALCMGCHGREKAMIRLDHKANQEDIHIQQDMVCTDCHSQREMHGDGTPYISLKQAGAMDTACENCHDDITPTESHTVHKDRLDCKACHVRHVLSCTNCHFDTLVKTGKRKALPVSGWLFLMNYNNKVTSASMQTFVTGGNKTFLMFAPHMSHSITKKGHACDDCHGSKNAVAVQKGKIRLTWLKNGQLINEKGIIPVFDGVDYQCVYQNFNDGNWIPIKAPLKPVIQYAAFGKPLTTEQLEKMARQQSVPPLQIK